MTFDEFKASEPAQSMFRKLGLSEYLEAADSWRMLRALLVHYNDTLDRGAVVKIARRCDGVCSSGERVLLHAILYAVDFAWLSDKMDGAHAWRRLANVSGEWRRAVAACIAAEV